MDDFFRDQPKFVKNFGHSLEYVFILFELEPKFTMRQRISESWNFYPKITALRIFFEPYLEFFNILRWQLWSALNIQMPTFDQKRGGTYCFRTGRPKPMLLHLLYRSDFRTTNLYTSESSFIVFAQRQSYLIKHIIQHFDSCNNENSLRK